jgi:L-2-hydroxyglutarate oxidase LhgO
MTEQTDILIAGAGIVGLAIGRILKDNHPNLQIDFLEKESEVGFHSSGRNSGVLHAGFYYTANSLKAKFTRDGNKALKAFCAENGIRVNPSEKIVVAQSPSDVAGLRELEKRGRTNGVDVHIVDENEVKKLDPNVKTHQLALYSPTTATVNPKEICIALKKQLSARAVRFHFDEGFRSQQDHIIKTTKEKRFRPKIFVNCAGLYADHVAKHFGFSKNYTIIPFKGVYLKYTGSDHPIKKNVYPVPNLKNPFLGVHFTITVDNHIKIGPTAIPAFWRENYSGLSRFNTSEFFSIVSKEAALFLKNSFHFRSLALDEMKKYNKNYFVGLAAKMLHTIDPAGFTEWTPPGIRAQLLNLNTNELVQDFVVEADQHSVHVLNAVSPAFTGSFPFAEWIYDNYLKRSLAL